MAKKLLLKNNKGFSIAEICVVIAVLMISITMVLSFSTLVSYHSGQIIKEKNLQDDISLVRETMNAFALSFDTSEYSIYSQGGMLYAVRTVNSKKEINKIWFNAENNKLIVNYDEDNVLETEIKDYEIELSETKNLTFYVGGKSEKHKSLIQLELVYTNVSGNTKQETLFKTFYAANNTIVDTPTETATSENS